VKLGAMNITYRGTAEFEELDTVACKMRVRARGRERSGAGSAEMTVRAQVAAKGPAASEVALEASVSVTGRIVTLGRGMIEIVSEQMLSDFAACLCRRLACAREEIGPGQTPPPDSGSNAEAVSAAGVLWRAIKSWLRRLLGRR